MSLSTLTVEHETLMDLHIVRAQMSKAEGRSLPLREVLARLVAAYQPPC